MATFALIHGAGSDGWFWHLLQAELAARGHDSVAPDLPCDDDSAGLAEYTDTVVGAVGDRTDLVVVGQSMGALTAPLVAARRPVERLVLLAAMTPVPGEPPGDWWGNTGWEEAHGALAAEQGRELGDEFDVEAEFLHDLPADVKARLLSRPPRDQSGTPFEEPWPLATWPDVPTHFLLARDDRFFPAAFQRRVVPERLGIVPDEIDGGHLVALSRPAELADRLVAYLKR
jgi:pimeloyl-ACP methyl ester carboxylesterase